MSPANPSRDEGTPRPWTVLHTGSEGASIVASGRYPRVARLTNADLPTCQADAALIVEAVNAYDRLRAIEAAARAVEGWPWEEWADKFDHPGVVRDALALREALEPS